MKKATILIAIIATLSLSGCGYIKRSISGWTGDATKTCVDGVTYLNFTTGTTVQYDRNGKVVPCN